MSRLISNEKPDGEIIDDGLLKRLTGNDAPERKCDHCYRYTRDPEHDLNCLALKDYSNEDFWKKEVTFDMPQSRWWEMEIRMDKDIKLVMAKTGCSERAAGDTLKECRGVIDEAVLMINKNRFSLREN